jgi:hypothetical protein
LFDAESWFLHIRLFLRRIRSSGVDAHAHTAFGIPYAELE